MIGVGGGFDILTALRFDAAAGHRHRDQRGHPQHPAGTSTGTTSGTGWGTQSEARECGGRHYLSTTPERFDIIQLSGVDSYSGTPGAAHVFSENYLYTAEAFDLYLSRLSDRRRAQHDASGALSRARDAPRADHRGGGALAHRGLRSEGAHRDCLREHGVLHGHARQEDPVLRGRDRRPETMDLATAELRMSAEPGSSRSEIKNAYQDFLSLEDERLERQFIRRYPFAIDPAVDDRPFFFNFSFWWHLLPGQRLFRGPAAVLDRCPGPPAQPACPRPRRCLW